VPKRVGRTTSRTMALNGFKPSDYYNRGDTLQKHRAKPGRTVTAARATLIQDLAQGL
jgi:hypothetical protein